VTRWIVLHSVQLLLLTFVNYFYYYTLNSLSLFSLAESVQWIFEVSACDAITEDYAIIMSRTLKVAGDYVMQERCAWFLRVIISTSLALSCLPSAKKQKRFLFCFASMYNKRIIKFGFVISRIIKVSVRVNPYLDLLNILKTSSNNCL